MDILKKVMKGEDLTEDEAKQALKAMISGDMKPVQAAALLVGLKMKGETIKEVAAFAEEMRANAMLISPSKEHLVDTCGTGGDSKGTFNISTTSAFIAAGAGVPVAKHGNRAVSSKCGSADLLEELGVKMLPPKDVEDCINQTGFGFMFAPLFHPAMKNIMPVRKELGVRTVFNLLGPLTNPANAKAQVLGVYDPELTEKFAGVLKELGITHALVVHSEGMDEIGFGETRITELKDGDIKTYNIDGKSLGFENREVPKAESRGQSAAITMGILKGDKGPARDICVLNAAAAIYVAGKAESIEEGIRLAEESIDSGKALQKLEEVVKFTGERHGHS